MQTHDLQQGSQAWHEFRATHFGASEAPIAFGKSKYQSRSDLMHQKHTGIVPDVDAGKQALFDKGHAAEIGGRVMAEKIIGESLSPVVVSKDVDGLPLSASLDGITFDDEIIFEHKLLSEKLTQQIMTNTLDEHYTIQMDQQLLVSGAKKCLFMASDGTDEGMAYCWYETTKKKCDQLIVGWSRFAIDLAAYTQPEVIHEVVAAPIKDLPAITYKLDGIHLSTNLRNDVKPAILALVEQSKKPLETDQDFADLDALCKKFKQAEEQCALVQSQAVGEIKDVDAFCRDLKELSEIMRQARIAGEKAVTSEKDARKLAILTGARDAFAKHINGLAAEIKHIQLPVIVPDFAGAIKGMKKLAAMQEAVDNTLRDSKMLADSTAQDIRAKLAWCKEHAAGMSMLFPDLQQIIVKPMDDFTLTITSRIDKHKAAEAHAKAVAEIKEREATQGAPLERGRGDEQLTHHNPADEAAAIEARRKQAQIAEQSKPFNGAPAKPVLPPDAFWPSSEEIVDAVAAAFETDAGTALNWLQQADFTNEERRGEEAEIAVEVMERNGLLERPQPKKINKRKKK